MARILVVDDDGHIRDVIRFALESEGHEVLEARDGGEALDAFRRENVDLVVLDIVMPVIDGRDVCLRLREKSTVPIIFLSSRDEELDRISGIELGADDYMGKPFSPRELVARVNAIFRRLRPAHTPANDTLALGPLTLDLARHQCAWAERTIVLTVTEFSLLRGLMESPGRVLTRTELVERAYGVDHAITERTVDSHIRRVRKKLADAGGNPIETVYGLGYRMREDL